MRKVYYRTNGGKIGFIKGTLIMFEEHYVELEDGTYREEKEFAEVIEKTSPFPIDLIKAGDFVNDRFVIENSGKSLILEHPEYEHNQKRIDNDEIESIVTKEQFELSKFYVRYE